MAKEHFLGLGAGGRRSFLRSVLLGAASLGFGPAIRKVAKASPLVDELSRNFVLRGETRSIKVASQYLFRPERLLIPDEIASSFLIKDILIAGKSQFASVGSGVPGEVFSTSGFGIRLAMDRTAPGGEIELVVENISGKAQRFCSAVIGSASVPREDGVTNSSRDYVLGVHSDDPYYAEALREVDSITPGSQPVGRAG